MTKKLDDNHVCIIALFLLSGLCNTSHLTSASDSVSSFNFTASDSNADNCTKTFKCLGGAHRYGVEDIPEGQNITEKQFAGRLTLIDDSVALKRQSAGILYYGQPVRLLDKKTQRAASFSTSYEYEIVMETFNTTDHSKDMRGDGMTFVMSADNSEEGTAAKCLGIYDGSGSRSSKTIVVEFDSYQNTEDPVYDISDNHVSFDFETIKTDASANASDVNITMWYPREPLYTWIDYSAETKKLEVRINRNSSRPLKALLSRDVNLLEKAEEKMWVGFSAGNGDAYSSFYITDWKFNSSGLPPEKNPKGASNMGVIVGVAVGVPILMALVGISVLLIVRRRRASAAMTLGSPLFGKNMDLQLQLSGMPESFSYKQLSTATRSFSEESKLGQGGFGSVYRGVLPASGVAVAVKKIGDNSKQGSREFLAEVSIISQLRHRNLIQLVGWCGDRGQYLLVYELMPNGSLDKALFVPSAAADHDGTPQPRLSWKQRLNIITGTAAALDYLHQGWKQQVIHRDVKASNIMLDNEWNAKLGDFGLARLVDHSGPAATTMVAGTYGYIAPEAAIKGKFTDKTDVYAFGAVMLEVACGRRSFSAGGEVLLVDLVWEQLSAGELLSVVDENLGDEYDIYWMEVLLLMGLLCSHPDPKSRPSMRHVVQVLAGDSPVPSVPASKPAVVYDSDNRQVNIQDLYNHDSRKHSVSRTLSSSFLSSSRSSKNSFSFTASSVTNA